MAVEAVVIAAIGWFMSPINAKVMQSMMTSRKEDIEESKLPSLGADQTTAQNQRSLSPRTRIISRMLTDVIQENICTMQNRLSISPNTLINAQKSIR